jgi:hypothetical protein
LLLKNLRRARQLRIPGVLAFIGAAWFLIALFSLIDLPLGSGLYVSALANPDNSYRVEVVAQLAHTSRLPPFSPFFAGKSETMLLRYHYFWFMLCGMIPKLTGWRIGARDALNASIAWLGYLLLAMVGLYWKFFFKVRDALRKSIASVPVLLLGGLQGPAFFVSIFVHRWHRGLWQLPLPAVTWIDGWGQITYWLDSLLWAPHCVAAALASLGALLALYEMSKTADGRQRAVLMLAASLGLASTVGLSVFVCVPFFAYLGVLCVYRLFKAPGGRLWMELAFAAGLAVLLIAPYLVSLREPVGAAFPLALSIRSSNFANLIAEHMHGITAPGRQFLNLAAKPLVFFYELGMMAVIAICAAARLTVMRGEEERNRNRMILLFVSITTLIALFVSSRGISGVSNDLGWRAPLGALFLLIFYGVWFFAGWRKDGLQSLFPSWARQLRPALKLLIVLGFATTVTEFMLLRFYYVANNTREAGAYTENLRAGLDFLRHNSAPEAVVQLNPEKDDPTYSGLFMERGTALRQTDDNSHRASSHFVDAASPELRLWEKDEIEPIFDDTGLQFGQVQQRCSTLGIDYLVFQPDDAVFADNISWIWRVAPLYANRSVRIYRCRPAY